MAGERKENSVLFSLKELKDITSDEPEAPVRAKAAPAPARRPSALDDKDDLLADLRSSVAADAEAEAQRLDAQRRAAQEEEERKIHATASMARAEIEARIAAEQARRRAAEEERVERARQIDIAERRARGEIIEDPVPAHSPEPAVHVTHTQAAQPQVAQVMMPQQPQGRGTAFYLTVVGLPVLCLTAVAIALIVQKEPLPQAANNEPVVINMAAPITAAPTQAPAPFVATIASEPPAPASEEPKKVVRKTGGGGQKPGGGGQKPGGGTAPAAAKKPGIQVDLTSD
jgi:hypothetical protein